jgi:MFS family permease
MPPVRTSSPNKRRAILAIAISAIALETALLGMVAPLLPEIEKRTGAGDEALGLALAAYAIPILAASIPVGRLADRLGRRPLLLGGLILTGLGSILIAVSGALGPLLAGRAVQGVGSTLSWVAALALVSDLARPGRKGEAIGFALAANSLGAIGGPALGGVVGGTVSFEAPFFLVSGIATAMFAAGWVVLPRAPAKPSGEPIVRSGSFLSLLRPAAALPAAACAVGAALLGRLRRPPRSRSPPRHRRDDDRPRLRRRRADRCLHVAAGGEGRGPLRARTGGAGGQPVDGDGRDPPGRARRSRRGGRRARDPHDRPCRGLRGCGAVAGRHVRRA